MKLWQYYSEQQEKHIQEPISVPEETMQHMQKNIIIPQFCQHGLLIHPLFLKMPFSTFFDVIWSTEAAIYTNNLLSSNSIVCYLTNTPDNTPGIAPKVALQDLNKDAQKGAPKDALKGALQVALAFHSFKKHIQASICVPEETM